MNINGYSVTLHENEQIGKFCYLLVNFKCGHEASAMTTHEEVPNYNDPAIQMYLNHFEKKHKEECKTCN